MNFSRKKEPDFDNFADHPKRKHEDFARAFSLMERVQTKAAYEEIKKEFGLRYVSCCQWGSIIGMLETFPYI